VILCAVCGSLVASLTTSIQLCLKSPVR
jgi:hypothetical protein